MATVEERRKGAIIGSLVGDATVQPIHWNYNKEILAALLKTKDEWGFWEPSQNPFYILETGKQTCYGDQNFLILKSIVENKGINVQNIKQTFYDTFGPGTNYDNPIWSGGPKKVPIEGGWRNNSIRVFLKNFEEQNPDPGCDVDEQVDAVLRIIPVAALYAGHPALLDKVAQVVKITQTNDIPVAFGMMMARLLEIFILHGPTHNAIEQLQSQLRSKRRKRPTDLDPSLVSQLSEVLNSRQVSHMDAANNIFKNN
ncbi:crystallin J1A-like [Argonauta hians]